jgi:hypothetical protein
VCSTRLAARRRSCGNLGNLPCLFASVHATTLARCRKINARSRASLTEAKIHGGNFCRENGSVPVEMSGASRIGLQSRIREKGAA